ncbi:MAG: hypothetical protein VZS44_05600 [Bacilli bacterium]|nr:hypothetical protein [Bacilli bacterium]
MGRINKIGGSTGVGNSKQLSLEQQAYSSLIKELENSINNIKTYNINKNAKAITNKYPITKGGYFGKKGSSTKIRVINTDKPISEAENFFNKISKGYTYIKSDGNVKLAYLPDGSIITYRVYTKTSKTGNSPAVDINIKSSKVNPKIKNQRIHFEEEKKYD